MSAERSPIRVVLVDDDPAITGAVKLKLRSRTEIEVVATGSNGRDALQLANRHKPDVMVLDVNMPVLNGLKAAARIAHAFPALGVLILTSEEAQDIAKQAIRGGPGSS